jgi:hypothetical protein
VAAVVSAALGVLGFGIQEGWAMSNFLVADVCTGKPDSTGAPIRDVYTKVEDIYAVYQTDQRVMIQFADDQALGADQRKSLADLYITRGTINWMLDEIRATSDQNRIARGHRYERRLADTLVIALQGQTQQAVAELEGLKTDLAEESKSRNRLMYLMAAGVVGLAVIAVVAFINSPVFSYHEPVAQTLWYAACVGIVGAFFSIAIAIRNRTVETGRITRDTIIDAALRILVGALAGAVLVALVKAQAFSLKLGGLEIGDSGDLLISHGKWLLVFLIALVAGFSERLVPDLLIKAVASNAAAPVRKPRDDMQANERNPLGTPDGKAAQASAAGAPGNGVVAALPEAAEPADEDDDNCCDGRAEGPATEDVELPEALGGVEDTTGVR